VGAASPRLQGIKPGADVVAEQVQHLAPKPPIRLDLRSNDRAMQPAIRPNVRHSQDKVPLAAMLAFRQMQSTEALQVVCHHGLDHRQECAR
jgi:hypothetical protein